MSTRHAFVDEVALAREFATDDHVRKTTHRDTFHSPYVGRVLYSDHQTGKVMVQWPWGPEHEQPSELIRDASEASRPPMILDQLPNTVERAQHSNSDADFKADEKYRRSLSGTMAQRVAQIYNYEQLIRRIAEAYEIHTLPIKRAVCLAFHKGQSEIEAYVSVGSRYASVYGTEPVRLTVSNFYETARRLAIYWKDNSRRYKVTQKEKAAGRLKCPRCASPLKPKTYRQGKKIFNCGACGFSISPEDLV